MKRIITLLSLMGVVTLMGLNSCVKEDFVSESSKALVDIESVTMTAHDFVLEDGSRFELLWLVLQTRD